MRSSAAGLTAGAAGRLATAVVFSLLPCYGGTHSGDSVLPAVPDASTRAEEAHSRGSMTGIPPSASSTAHISSAPQPQFCGASKAFAVLQCTRVHSCGCACRRALRLLLCMYVMYIVYSYRWETFLAIKYKLRLLSFEFNGKFCHLLL